MKNHFKDMDWKDWLLKHGFTPDVLTDEQYVRFLTWLASCCPRELWDYEEAQKKRYGER